MHGRLKDNGDVGESSLRGQRPDGHYKCEVNKLWDAIPQLFLAARDFVNVAPVERKHTENSG
jgi:hypothetical protein